MRRALGWLTFVTTCVLVTFACRHGEPTGDPVTPSNSPLPKIDRKEKDPKAAPTPELGGDAG